MGEPDEPTKCGGEHGWQTGPTTNGEARTLVGILTGVPVERIECFVLVSVLRCQNCCEPHDMLTTQDCEAATAMSLLQLAAMKTGQAL